MNCPCICPEVDCGPVLTCIKADLTKIHTDNDPSMDNFCLAVAHCVNEQFDAYAQGLGNNIDAFGPAIQKMLQSLSGYTETGDIFLTAADGVFGWNTVSPDHTFVDDGNGISVTGIGSSGDPYRPNIISAYVYGLITGSNGINVASGDVKLGGALTQNTTITGGSTLNLSITGIQNFTLGVTGVTFLKVANYASSSSGDVLYLANPSTGEARWKPLPTFSTNFIQNQTGTNQSAGFKITGNATVGGRLTVGTTATVFGTTHTLKSLGDATIVTIQNSSGTEIAAITPSYIKIPEANSDPSPVFGAPYHQGSLYFNSLTGTFLGYYASLWTPLLYNTRIVNTQHSLTGGGDLSADRTINLVNDTAIPGISKYYGTNGSGTRGWFNLPGGVSSVDISIPTAIFDITGGPITSSGTFAITLDTQSANTVFAGPVTGAAATPTFRALVAADLPDDVVSFDKVQNITTGRILGRSTAGSGSVEQLSLGQHLVLSGGVLNTYGRTLIGVTKFTSSNTWVKPSGCNAVIVYVIGGGGGGAGSLANVAEASVGGGGGAGGSSIHYVTSGLGVSETVTIGAGGAAGIAGGNGGNATDSSFGAFVTSGGGFGGAAMASGSSAAVAQGGASGIGAGNILGVAGETGRTGIRLGTSLSTIVSGSGGGTILGHFTGLGINNGAGGTASGSINGGSSAGTAGSGGVVIVYELS